MRLQKTEWLDIIGTNIARHTVNAESSYTGKISCNDVHAYIKVSIRVAVDFGASPDGDVIINFFSLDESTGGANTPDTVPIWQQRIVRVTSLEKIVTIPNMNVISIDALSIEIINEDTTDSVDIWLSAIASYKS